jgi:hypothetical protein
MAYYNYKEAMKDDILEYCSDNSIDLETYDIDKLNEELWTEDSVTGNASGSYTFSTVLAKEYVMGNLDLLREACEEFGMDKAEYLDKMVEEQWEYLDVTIRCYLLGEAISYAIECTI